MVFSHKQAKLNAVAKKIYRAKVIAKAGSDPDFISRHPQEVKDAQQEKYTTLVNRIKQEVTRAQDRAQGRRDKLAGKN